MNDVKQIDRKTRDLNLSFNNLDEQFDNWFWISMALAGNALPVSTASQYNSVSTLKTNIFAFNIGTQTLLWPVVKTNGLDISGDQTAADWYEITLAYPGSSSWKMVFVVWAEPVGFFFEAEIYCQDISWVAELLAWFKKSGVGAAARSSISDYALIGAIGEDLKIATRLNTGTESLVDTTNDLRDNHTFGVRVEVDTDGNVSFKYSLNAFTTDFTFPTVNADFKFDSWDKIYPVIRMIQDTELSGTIYVKSLKCGYLN